MTLPRRYRSVFLSSRLDYCNALLYGMSEALLYRVQSIQNATARLVTGVQHRDHMSLILQQLHWLPM